MRSRCLTAILERYLPKKYFNCGLISAQVDQLVLKDLLASKLPQLAEHIQRMEIDISAITLNWFLAIFYDSVPFEPTKWTTSLCFSPYERPDFVHIFHE
ncbi:hypothetical protein X801_09560 [Opisthorchis viverrini]|uniref:Rab-GAP TBC domain-containing protein n=1 Tax=Opisthorchis viverrini TaxID=6198 RepID=A0A1S8WJL8_OPIVI|nr:hypothetical protein X801_09560 [Opisthorchis viverrini]